MRSYQRITRAFKQAPWRLQMRAAAAGAVVLIVCLVLGGLFLAEASRTATAGRRVQALEARKTELAREIAELRTQLANLRSIDRMQQRADEMGFFPASPDQVDYLVVDGYPGRQPALPVVQPLPPGLGGRGGFLQDREEPVVVQPLVPEFTETLSEWLVQSLFGVKVRTAEGAQP